MPLVFTFGSGGVAVTPPVVSNVVESALAQTSVVISWDVAPAAQGQIEYGLTGSYGTTTSLETSFLTSHSQSIPDLAVGTLYYYRIKALGASGVVAYSSQGTFETIAEVTNVATSAITATTATIGFTVTPASTAKIDYGTDSNYGSSTSVHGSNTAHSFDLSGLTASTLYHYRIVTTTAAGGVTTGSDRTFPTPPALPDSFPPTTTLTYLAKPVLTVPTLLQVKTDPQYGTEITRVNLLAGQGHRYSSKASWNCDETMLLLDYPPGGSGSNRPVLNGQTLAVMASTNSTGSNFMWSNTVANRGWATSGVTIRRMTVSAGGTISTAQTYSLTPPLGGTYSDISLGGGQGTQSNDDRYLSFMWKKTNNNIGVAVFDTTLGTVVTEVLILTSTGSLLSNLNNCGVSQSGTYVIVQGGSNGTGTGQGTRRYIRSTMAAGTSIMLSSSISHWDAGMLGDGSTDVFVQCSTSSFLHGGSAGLGMHRMSDGAFTSLLSTWPNGHVSCRNVDRPGWCYPSTFETAASTYPGKGTVFALNLDDPNQVQMFANVHGPSVESYVYEPHACASPSGDRVVFRHDWDTGAIGCIVAGMDVIR